MPKNDRTPPPSASFPFKPFSNPLAQPVHAEKLTPEEIDRELDAALRAEDPDRALSVMDAAPRWMQREPGFMVTRASMLIDIGENLEALQILRDVERKQPNFHPIYVPLAVLYTSQGWAAHSEKAALRALAHLESEEEEVRPTLEKIVEESRDTLQKMANELGLPLETMRRASTFNEQAQMALEEERLAEVDRLAREAIKVIPTWNAPHNNRAYALYFSGRMDEAIAVSEGVLERDPVNVFALSELIAYHYGLEQADKVREYAVRLRALVEKGMPAQNDFQKAVSALALVEDTETLGAQINIFMKLPAEEFFARTWHILAVAAVRQGRWKEARKLMRKTDELDDLSPAGEKFARDLEEVAGRAHPSLEWMPPAYPCADLLSFPKILDEWDMLAKTFSEPMSPSMKQRRDAFFRRYPFIVTAMKRTIWDEQTSLLSVQTLITLERPDTDAEIMRFALSQTGSLFDRAQAITSLNIAGRYVGPKTVKMWDEVNGEWRDEELHLQKVGPIEPKSSPETLKLIEKAAYTKKPDQAIALLRKAVEREPGSATALFNLGVRLAQNGEEEEGEALIYKSVEIDPTYTFGHASIALTEARMGHTDVAREHLAFVTQAEVIHPDTAAIANAALAFLAMEEKNFKQAVRYLRTALQFNSDHPVLEMLKRMLAVTDEKAEEMRGRP